MTHVMTYDSGIFQYTHTHARTELWLYLILRPIQSISDASYFRLITFTCWQIEELRRHMAKVACLASTSSFQDVLPPCAKVQRLYCDSVIQDGSQSQIQSGMIPDPRMMFFFYTR